MPSRPRRRLWLFSGAVDSLAELGAGHRDGVAVRMFPALRTLPGQGANDVILPLLNTAAVVVHRYAESVIAHGCLPCCLINWFAICLGA